MCCLRREVSALEPCGLALMVCRRQGTIAPPLLAEVWDVADLGNRCALFVGSTGKPARQPGHGLADHRSAGTPSR